ncbi:MAG: hypothetical protein R3Y58_05410 [Eubacteriales bacterium]
MKNLKNNIYDEELEFETLNDELNDAYLMEKELLLELEFEEELDEIHNPVVQESPDRKILKRELERVALSRLEASARTKADFENVITWWNRLDSNRERKERYHEVGRGDIPIEWGASHENIILPTPIGSVYWKQILKGEFLDVIFDCPFELHELVEDKDISLSIHKLKDEHKEVLYYLTIRQYSCQQIAKLRNQSDRNIRKVRSTILKKLQVNLLQTLRKKLEEKQVLTKRETTFLQSFQ